MKVQDFRVGNYVMLDGKLHVLQPSDLVGIYQCEIAGAQSPFESILITKDILLDFGFVGVEKQSYINGVRYLFQVSGSADNIEKQGINRDGTWFDGIGGYSWEKTGELGVNTLCRGNYICNSVGFAHQLQNLYYALTGQEFEFNSKSNKIK